jgi:hypothetical protein
MGGDKAGRNRALADMRIERVTKPDGRYLIHFSWLDRLRGERYPARAGRQAGFYVVQAVAGAGAVSDAESSDP